MLELTQALVTFAAGWALLPLGGRVSWVTFMWVGIVVQLTCILSNTVVWIVLYLLGALTAYAAELSMRSKSGE